MIDKVFISGVEWLVSECGQGELFEEYGEDLLGHVEWSKCEIRLRAGMPDDRAYSVLFHEIIHAISDDMALDLTEEAVRQLNTGIFGVLRSNPALVLGMMGAEESANAQVSSVKDDGGQGVAPSDADGAEQGDGRRQPEGGHRTAVIDKPGAVKMRRARGRAG